MTAINSMFDQLPDNEMLLALCIREEELDDPAAWCSELREVVRDSRTPPKTVDEVEALAERWDALRHRIKKARV